MKKENIMMLLKRTRTAALLAATFAVGVSATALSAQAAPAAASAANGNLVATNSDSDITKVQDRREMRVGGERGNRAARVQRVDRVDRGYRRDRVVGDYRGRYYDRGRRYRDYNDYGYYSGAYLGLGLADLFLDDTADDYGYGAGAAYSGGGLAMQRCAQQFRSFEPDTGLYTTYGGDKRRCPYLG